jgi:hypothetical protein
MQTSLSRSAWIRLTALVLAVAAATPAPGHGQISAGYGPLSKGLDPDSKWPAIESDWGVLDAPQSYRGEITITNVCTAPRPMEIFVTGLPTFLTRLEATIPAGGQVELPYLLDVSTVGTGTLKGQIAVWAPAAPDASCPASWVAYQVHATVVRSESDAAQPLLGVDRVDRYDYDGDGNFDEPDRYADALDLPAAGDRDRGHSYAEYFRDLQRRENARVLARRRQTVSILPEGFGRPAFQYTWSTTLPATVSPPVDTTPNEQLFRSFLASLDRPMLRHYTTGIGRPEQPALALAVGSAATNPASVAAADGDPTGQHVAATFSVLQVIEKAVVMARRDGRGPDRRLARWFGRAMPRLASAHALLPPPAWSQKATSSTPPAVVDDLLIYVTSTGPLGGGAIRGVLVNGTSTPIAIGKSVAVLEPVTRVSAKDVERELAALAHLPQKAVTLDAYCLERLKAPPAPGTVFRLAAPGPRARFARVAAVVDAARRLRDEKALTPDIDPDDYQHSIVQWAIWAQQERFDEKAFTAAFAAYTKKNVVASGAKWSREMDAAVAEIAPNRWRDISRIVQAAGAPVGVTTGQ